MSKEMSIESLYANGMGIVYEDKPINTIKQESYPCSSIIDNSYISNSLEYLEYHSIIEKNNTKDMIKLNKKLNDHYGKYNKSLENYLINNANTSKENYNNYINTNKELYNELIMSRETFGMNMKLLSITVTILSMLMKFLFKKIKSNVSYKMILNYLNKNSEFKNKVTDFSKEIEQLGESLSSISKNMKLHESITKDIEKIMNIKSIENHNFEFGISSGGAFSSKKKIFKDSINAIINISKKGVIKGENINMKQLVLENNAYLFFTFDNTKIDNYKTVFKSVNSNMKKIENIINIRLGKINKNISVVFNSVRDSEFKNGFSQVDFDIVYKYTKDYSDLTSDIEKITHKKM